MKSYIIDKQKLESWKSISDVLNEYEKQAENISVFNKGIEELSSHTKKLIKLQTLAEKDSSHIEEVRNQYRSELIEITLPVLTILKIYAYNQKKQKLEKQLEEITPEVLQQCPDIVLINTIQTIWQAANKYGGYSLSFFDKLKAKKIAANVKVITKLEKQYGLAPAMIKDLEEAFLLFINSFSIYENELLEKTDVIKKIKKTTARTEKLLENKLDRFVSLFEKKSPDFCQAYTNARLPGKKFIKSTELSANEGIESELPESIGKPAYDDDLQLEPKKRKNTKGVEQPIS